MSDEEIRALERRVEAFGADEDVQALRAARLRTFHPRNEIERLASLTPQVYRNDPVANASLRGAVLIEGLQAEAALSRVIEDLDRTIRAWQELRTRVVQFEGYQVERMATSEVQAEVNRITEAVGVRETYLALLRYVGGDPRSSAPQVGNARCTGCAKQIGWTGRGDRLMYHDERGGELAETFRCSQCGAEAEPVVGVAR